MTEVEAKDRVVFDDLDHNRDGLLTVEDLRSFEDVRSVQWLANEIARRGRGIRFDEFCAIIEAKRKALSDLRSAAADQSLNEASNSANVASFQSIFSEKREAKAGSGGRARSASVSSISSLHLLSSTASDRKTSSPLGRLSMSELMDDDRHGSRSSSTARDDLEDAASPSMVASSSLAPLANAGTTLTQDAPESLLQALAKRNAKLSDENRKLLLRDRDRERTAHKLEADIALEKAAYECKFRDMKAEHALEKQALEARAKHLAQQLTERTASAEYETESARTSLSDSEAKAPDSVVPGALRAPRRKNPPWAGRVLAALIRSMHTDLKKIIVSTAEARTGRTRSAAAATRVAPTSSREDTFVRRLQREIASDLAEARSERSRAQTERDRLFEAFKTQEKHITSLLKLEQQRRAESTVVDRPRRLPGPTTPITRDLSPASTSARSDSRSNPEGSPILETKSLSSPNTPASSHTRDGRTDQSLDATLIAREAIAEMRAFASSTRLTQALELSLCIVLLLGVLLPALLMPGSDSYWARPFVPS